MSHFLATCPRSNNFYFKACQFGLACEKSTYFKCYYDEKMFSFSADSDFVFGKNSPYQLLRLNFKNKSDCFNYDFSFKLSAIPLPDSVPVELHLESWFERESDVIYLVD